MKRARPLHRQLGLSLLEVLVTVTIFAMLFAVLTLGWHQSMNAQAKLGEAAEHARTHQQLALLLRQLISETLVPEYQAGTEFSADDKGFVAETSTSLLATVGAAPLAVSVKLETTSEGKRLQITHGEADSRPLPWRFSEARWRYLDNAGQWHDDWPPPSPIAGMPLPRERDSYLPALVAFSYTIVGESRSHELLAAPRASGWRLGEPSSPIADLNRP
ncbi:prepilin-type N-terminal cleavage/methylation domain-containing protein [Roseateles sp. NT4]|uniref:type II secretion system protein n=1 Tax=Roseateles sp. NT4 TaxID=3453715 RepID=UPI003EE8B60B